MKKISKIGKGEAVTWRPSAKLKAELEGAAKDEGTSVETILGCAVRQWLARRAPRSKASNSEQARKRGALLACAGYYEGDGTSATNERVREVVGDDLEAKYGRRHTR